MALGKEWIGRLPPGADEQLAEALDGYRTSGLVTGVELMAGPGCPVAEAMRGLIFPLDRVPELPFMGCVRSPCCACCFLAVLDDEGGS